MNITIPAIAVISAALMLAPAAQADPTDDANYLLDSMMMGLNPMTLGAPNPQAEIGLGHGICQHLANGHDPNGSRYRRAT